MERVSLLLVMFACLPAGCDRTREPSNGAWAVEPARLHALHAQCRRGAYDDAVCARVERAELQRFLSGRSGPDEYRTLAELPAIPPSFDGPADAPEARPCSTSSSEAGCWAAGFFDPVLASSSKFAAATSSARKRAEPKKTTVS